MTKRMRFEKKSEARNVIIFVIVFINPKTDRRTFDLQMAYFFLTDSVRRHMTFPHTTKNLILVALESLQLKH